MPKSQFNFTKAAIQQLQPPVSKNFEAHYDTQQRGLALFITPGGARTFYLQTKVNGQTKRVKIGSFPEVTIEQARKQVLLLKGDLAQGKLPKALEAKKQITFGAFFKLYMERHAKPNNRTWMSDEEKYKHYLHVWAHRPLDSLKRIEIIEMHQQIAQRGAPYAANRTISLVKSIYNRAIEWEYAEINPAQRIKFNREHSRDRFLQPDELPRFYAALDSLTNPMMQAIFELLLLTGARNGNMLAMRKEEIDFTQNVWRIPKTKNGHGHTVPLVPRAQVILKDMFGLYPDSPWVFPTSETPSGHIENLGKNWMRIVERANLKDLRIHDLRRSLASYQVISGANSFIIGQTLGHRSLQSTAVYARMNLEAVRTAMGNAVELLKRTVNPIS